MSKNLVIVESPAKARTIEKFLGEDFSVVSSMGHIRDLTKGGVTLRCKDRKVDTEYAVDDDKKKVIADLKKRAKAAEVVWLATDEDREGEAIAWHLEEVLGLQDKITKRIAFHEITKPAILKAIANPREIDRDLVNGQQARRVLDRLVGFELSPVLWKKIQTGLSAGRVQSVAVRLVVEREREINAFTPVSSFKVIATVETEAMDQFAARLPKDLTSLENAEDLLERLQGKSVRVGAVERKPARRAPPPPFTTSTLQQAASSRLGFTLRQTMSLAQRLYESGKITYMRTDSVNMSEQALAQAGEYVSKTFGKDYAERRQYKTKSSSAQEAHEAIRPTDFTIDEVSGERNEQRLYRLIWERALGSQMSDARFERTTATLHPEGVEEHFVAKGEVLTFDGFLRVQLGAGKSSKQESDAGDDEADDNDDKRLPPLEPDQILDLISVVAEEQFSRAPARFTEASLVRKLEEMGIGRPSTYAPTITTIQNRGYVTKEEREGTERTVRRIRMDRKPVERDDRTEITGRDRSKLFPSDIAGIVTDFLVKQFEEVIDYQFTAKVEEQFDEISEGRRDWQEMICAFYQPFHQDVEAAELVSREEAAQVRQLGNDPETGRPVSVRVGRYGVFAQIGTRDDEEKPQFAGLRADQRMDAVTLEDVLPLFKLPRHIGQTENGEDVSVNTGRFGPYASLMHHEIAERVEAWGEKGIGLLPRHVSIDPHDPHSIDIEAAMPLIEAKRAEDNEKELRLFEGERIQVLDGRWGPYITDGFKNAKVDKEADPTQLTLEQCQEALGKVDKVRKRLSSQFHGGGYLLHYEPEGGLPHATLKTSDAKAKKAIEFAKQLADEGLRIRVISASGAAQLRLQEKRAAAAAKKKK